MADEPNQGATGEAPPVDAAAATAGAGSTYGSYGESPLSVDAEHDAFAERPEIFVGAAFLGGLVAAQILRRLTR
jgi:hypothetical protein